MKQITLRSNLQVWVCVNERENGAALPSCGRGRGDAVLSALRSSLLPVLRGLGVSAWMNRTLCQGFCHAEGVTVTIEPLGLKYQAVTEADVDELVSRVKNALLTLA